MSKRKLKLSLLLLLGLGFFIGCAWLFIGAKPAATTSVPVKTTVKPPRPAKPKPIRQLSVTELKHHPALRYSCIIYYAIKHTKIQRWQEVSDFQLGWQVEIYHPGTQAKYLVWPDKDIKSEAKQLAPNWFRLDANGQVTYHSFVVHSFRDDQLATASLITIVNQVNADHAAKQVRQMPANLVILKHAH